MPVVRFTVYGIAAPKSGMKPVPIRRDGVIVGSRMTASSPRGAEWASRVQAEALKVCGEQLMFPEGPVVLTVHFLLPRPLSAPKRVTHHVTRPDATKLVRCLEDALTGVIWRDDSQVVELHVHKGFALDGRPRAEVTVSKPSSFIDVGGAQHVPLLSHVE